MSATGGRGGELSTGAGEDPRTAAGPSCSSIFLFEHEESEVHDGEVTSLRSHGSLRPEKKPCLRKMVGVSGRVINGGRGGDTAHPTAVTEQHLGGP